MKRMLFNATQSEELRVAIVEGTKLIDLDIETAGKEHRKSNIYKGIITRIEPSLEAAFVDYGANRHGFLPFKEVSKIYFKPSEYYDFNRLRIQDVLSEGQEIIIQVVKDERGNKGAALTTFISLAGRYLVLMPNNPRAGGISRRIEGDERAELRDILSQLNVPLGMSLIVRTAGIGRSIEEIEWDFNYLSYLWQAIEDATKRQTGAFLIYQEGSLVIRAMRDYFQPDIEEILIDAPSVYEQAVQFMSHVMPHNMSRLKLYRDTTPLFTRFQIEHQIETAYGREVPLPSGGAIVIDHTEALTSVDVNSGRATRGADIEQTAFQTNLEAAEEVARQLRLRDLGGLVVIDFIDMDNPRNQRDVENRLRDSLHTDRARVQMGKISRFGLLELSRQRLQPSIGETIYKSCPHCHGTGHIRSNESFSLHILRLIEEESIKESVTTIYVQLPVETATYLLNEKRQHINQIESRSKKSIVLIPSANIEIPHYEIKHIYIDEPIDETLTASSHKLIEYPNSQEDVDRYHAQYGGNKKNERAMVQTVHFNRPDTQRYVHSLAYEDNDSDLDDHFFNPSLPKKTHVQEQKSQPQLGNPFNMNNQYNQEYHQHRRSVQQTQQAQHVSGSGYSNNRSNNNYNNRRNNLDNNHYENNNRRSHYDKNHNNYDNNPQNLENSTPVEAVEETLILTPEQERNEATLKTIINMMKLMRKSAEIPEFPANRNDSPSGRRDNRRPSGKPTRSNPLDNSTASTTKKAKYDPNIPAVLAPYADETSTASEENNFELDARGRRPRKAKKERVQRDRYAPDLLDEPLIVHLGNKNESQSMPKEPATKPEVQIESKSYNKNYNKQDRDFEYKPRQPRGRQNQNVVVEETKIDPIIDIEIKTIPVEIKLEPVAIQSIEESIEFKQVERKIKTKKVLPRESFNGIFFPFELIHGEYLTETTEIIEEIVIESVAINKKQQKTIDNPLQSELPVALNQPTFTPAGLTPLKRNENIDVPKIVQTPKVSIEAIGVDAILDLSLNLIRDGQLENIDPIENTNIITQNQVDELEHQAEEVNEEKRQEKLSSLLESLLGSSDLIDLALIETRHDLGVVSKQALESVNPVPPIEVPENASIREVYFANKLEESVEHLIQVETRNIN